MESEHKYKSKNKISIDKRNVKINNRTFESTYNNSHNDNINRTLMERDDIFNNFNVNEKYAQNDSKPKRNYVNKKLRDTSGEITGEDFEISEIDQGMPLRSQYNTNRNNIDLEKSYNKYLDFNIFDEEQPQSNLEVSYFDPNGGSMYNFSDIGKNSLTKKNNPVDVMSTVISDYSFFIYENIRNLMPSTTVIATHSIVNILASLYISSKGSTEAEIKTYLSLLDRDSTFLGSTILTKYLNKSQCYDFKNIVLLNKNLQYNSNFIKYIEPLVQYFTVNTFDAQKEAHKLNVYLNSQYNNIFGQIFRKDHIENLDITCLTVGLLRTVWKVPFNKIINMNFGKNVVKMMVSQKENYKYYEDINHQCIELDFYDNILSMGIILPKQNIKFAPNINSHDFETILNSLKPTILSEVAIPEFKVQSKVRNSNILKETGLVNFFSKADFPELLNETSNITDFVQNFTLIVENKSINSNNGRIMMKNKVIDNKFIANKPFMYYFKLLQTGTIIIVGQYYGTI